MLAGMSFMASMRLIVRALTNERWASSSMLQPKAARAALICKPVRFDILPFWHYLGQMALNSDKSQDWLAQLSRLEGAYAPSTIRAYYDDVRSFVDWCARHGREPFPAEISTICGFVDEQGKRLVPTTVRRRLVAIGKLHRLMGLFDPTRDEDVRLALRRAIRSRTKPPQQARGMSRAQLRDVLAVQPDTPWGIRDSAILALGFEMLARRSELVALRDDDLDWRPDGTLRVTIRRSKTDQAGLGRYVFTSRETARVVRRWIDWRGSDFEFLFCPIYQGQAVCRDLNSVTVRRAIRKGAARAGLEFSGEIRGHSLRVGAAQELLCAGHDTVAIMRAGGWKSVATLARYLEFAEHNVWESETNGRRHSMST